MIVSATDLTGVFDVASVAHADERGSFRRAWCRGAFAAAGLTFEPIQASLSYNISIHTLRGMHYQIEPAAEQKLVRCVHGDIFDVALDVRLDSPSRGQYIARRLSASEGNALFIPRGFAHGFLTLTPNALVEYLIDSPYTPALSHGVRWNDKAYKIAWPASPAVISERDASWPDVAWIAYG